MPRTSIWRTKLATFALVAIASSLVVSSARACFAPPPSLTEHHTDLITQSEVIVLARVIGAANKATYDTLNVFEGPSLYERPLAQFETVENLRGKTPKTFSFNGGSLSDVNYDLNGDFDKHRASVFWDKNTTRQWNDVDCRMYPVFEEGKTYLLFIDRPHWRGYEEIAHPADDFWLAAVRRVLADPSAWSGLSLDLKSWLTLSRGVFVGHVQSCEGPTLSVDSVMHGNFEDTWRYSNEDNAEHWPDGECEVGRQYLVIATRDAPEILPQYSSSVLPVHDGFVDFGPAFAESDVDVQAFRIQKLHEISALFSGKPHKASAIRN